MVRELGVHLQRLLAGSTAPLDDDRGMSIYLRLLAEEATDALAAHAVARAASEAERNRTLR